MRESATAAVKTPDVKPARIVSQNRKPEISSLPTTFHEQIAVLQRSIGNRAVHDLFNSGVLKAKLRVSQPNDIYEQEADRAAEQVMRMPEPTVQLKPG